MIKTSINQKGIATLLIQMDNVPMNVINEGFARAFHEAFENVATNNEVKGIIITSGKKEFMAGADLNMIRGLDDAAKVTEQTMQLHQLFRRMETCGKPVVAAINGTALGGGFELCLAAHYRVALNESSSRIGLPEVLLGLLPGGGGTQRLPRLIGMQNALQLILEGKTVRPAEAKKNGMVHDLADTREEMLEKAENFILENPKATQPWDRKDFKVPDGKVQSPNGFMIFAAGSALMMKKTYGNYPAAQAILSCVYEGLQIPFDKAINVEVRYFTQCVLSKESRQMVKTLFFNKNAADKGKDRPEGYKSAPIQKLGILGAGMMGAGIAYAAANVGIPVVLKDVSKEAAEKGKEYSLNIWNHSKSKGYISQEEFDKKSALIFPTDNYDDLKGCDMVIEAVFEDRELKATVTKDTEAMLEDTAIFASNTSTLPITGLAEASVRPENFIGIHFFSPVDKMQLVEIILGKKTSDYAISRALDLVRALKKTPIVVNDSRGFYTSRIFTNYLAEGFQLLSEGTPAALIENAAKAAGMMVGPLAVADEVSIELIYKIVKQTEKDLGEEIKGAHKEVAINFVEKLKRPGKKAGAGFYEYPQGGKKFLWPDLTKHYPIQNNHPDEQTVKNRLMYIQAIESYRCLEENVLRFPEDGDIGSILGLGFAPFSGGALSYIDYIGVEKFVKEADRLVDLYGERFRVPDSLRSKKQVVA